jgi:tRNA threonylcarbamoyladenosine biosynthesis protein TsaE
MILKSVQEGLADTAHQLLIYAGNQRIFLLEGPMGSGKTTLIKRLCSALGTLDLVNSPTFSLINEYTTTDNDPIYHFDCYRINGIADAISLDFDSYFFSGCYCFIEWSSKIKAILAD